MKPIKKISILMLAMAFFWIYPSYTDDSVPTVFVNRTPVPFSENQPILKNNRTMIPLREMFRVFHFEASYHEDTQTIYLRNDDEKIFFRIGDLRFFTERGNIIQAHDLDVAPILQDSRTYLPLRAIAEALGAEVVWDGKTASVFITLKDS